MEYTEVHKLHNIQLIPYGEDMKKHLTWVLNSDRTNNMSKTNLSGDKIFFGY